MQLLTCLFAHPVHRALAARADLLVFGQVVFDTGARQIGWQWFATALLMGWSIHGRQAGVGQCEDTVRIVFD